MWISKGIRWSENGSIIIALKIKKLQGHIGNLEFLASSVLCTVFLGADQPPVFILRCA